LADALQLTDNAARAQLATLERDGLVRLSGSRAGSRKPNLTYEVTGDAERLFPKPYGALLHQLLVVLAEPTEAVHSVLLQRQTEFIILPPKRV
jgi:predicted ArsR family transcriptional regulator